MPIRSAWKMLRPEEQLIELVREVRAIRQALRQYTRIQGVRLESRMVLGERHLFATIQDPTATNNGVTYQITP